MSQIEHARIVVVGGDSYFAYLIRRFLGIASHDMILADLGDDVGALAAQNHSAAVVLEVIPRESAGWKILRDLKTCPETTKIPIILCSWTDEKQRSLDEGADVFLSMPILYEDFGAALEAVGISAGLDPADTGDGSRGGDI